LRYSPLFFTRLRLQQESPRDARNLLSEIRSFIGIKIHARYKKVSDQHGSEIKGVHYITRSERLSAIYENADFSTDTIKASIKDGEFKTNQILKGIKSI
jgi:hypothetical protein